MTSIEPQLWVDRPREALAFYEAAFGATILHRVGDGDDIVARAAVLRQAVAAGATEASAVSEEHGWRLGRIIDPFGHEWEIGAPLRPWPPS